MAIFRDRYDERKLADALITHYRWAWMADYDATEVGEYLQDFSESYTGDFEVSAKRYDGGMGWPANRISFLKWRYEKTNPLPAKEEQINE